MHAKSQTHKTINLVLFDFDGTLYPKDSFTGFIFFTLSKTSHCKKRLKILLGFKPIIYAYILHAMRARLFQTMFEGISATFVENLVDEYAQKLIKELDPALLKHFISINSVVIILFWFLRRRFIFSTNL